MRERLTFAYDWANERRALVAAWGVVGLALLLQLWRLGTLPPGVSPAEAVIGTQALALLGGGFSALEFSASPSPLLVLLAAPLHALFDPGSWALRLPGAFAATAAVGITYLLGKELFSKRVGLLAALMMATAPWAVGLGRTASGESLTILLAVLLGWLLVKALQTGEIRYWASGGAVLGVGIYAHAIWLAMPGGLLILLAAGLWRWRSQLQSHAKGLLLAGAAALLLLAPFALYTAQAGLTNNLFSPAIDAGEINPEQTLTAVATDTAKTLLMFNFSGDGDWLYNLPSQPQLNALAGIMLLLGLLISLRRITQARYMALVIFFAVTLVPAIFSGRAAPDSLAQAAAVPIVFLLAAIGINELLLRWRGVFPQNPAAYSLALAIVAGLLAFAALVDVKRYFIAYARAPEMFNAYDAPAAAAASVLRTTTAPTLIVSDSPRPSLEYLAAARDEYELFVAPTAIAAEPGSQLIALGISRRTLGALLPAELELTDERDLTAAGGPQPTLGQIYNLQAVE